MIISIVSKLEERNQSLPELGDFLKSQEYSTKLIIQGITEAEPLTTTELRQTKEDQKNLKKLTRS